MIPPFFAIRPGPKLGGGNRTGGAWMFDIAIIGLGPAGATLARLLAPRFRVAAFDRKGRDGQGFQKPCGGLLAPDAQKALARFGLTLPKTLLVDPQIFSVRTIDLGNGMSSVTYGTVTETEVSYSVASTLDTVLPKLVPLALVLMLYFLFAKHNFTPIKGIVLLGAGPFGLWPSIW